MERKEQQQHEVLTPRFEGHFETSVQHKFHWKCVYREDSNCKRKRNEMNQSTKSK